MFETILRKGKRLVAYGLATALVIGSVQGNYMSAFAEAENSKDVASSELVYNGQSQFPDYVTKVGQEVTPGDVSNGDYGCKTNGIDAGTHVLFSYGEPDQNLVINPKNLEVQWIGGNEFTYTGQPVSVPAASAETGVSGESVTLTVSVSDGDQIYEVDKVVSAGDYIVTASIGSVTGGQEKPDNYTLSNEQYAFTIKQAQNQFTKGVSCGDVIYGELPQPYNAEAAFGEILYRYYNEDDSAAKDVPLEYVPYQIGNYSVEAYVVGTGDYTEAVSNRQTFSIVYGTLPQGVNIDAVLNFAAEQGTNGYYRSDVVVTAKDGYILCDENGTDLSDPVEITKTTQPYTFYVKSDNAALPAVMSADAMPDGKVIKLEQDILIDKYTPGFVDAAITNADGNALLVSNEIYWTNSEVTVSFELEETTEEGQTQTERTVTYTKSGVAGSVVIEEVDGKYSLTIVADELTNEAATYTFYVTDKAGNQSKMAYAIAKDSELPAISDIKLPAEVDNNSAWLNAAELVKGGEKEDIIVAFKLDNVASGIKEISYQVSSGDSLVYENKLENVQKSEDGTYNLTIPGTAWVEGAEQKIAISVTDFAQNTNEEEITFSVDVTKPEEAIFVQFTSDVKNAGFSEEDGGFVSEAIKFFAKLFGRNKVSYEVYVKDGISGISSVELSYKDSAKNVKLDKMPVMATVGSVEGYSVFAGSFTVKDGEQVTVSELSVVSVVDNAGNVLTGEENVLTQIAGEIYIDAINPVLSSVTVEGKRNNAGVEDDLSGEADVKRYYQEAPVVNITIFEEYFNIGEAAPIVKVFDAVANEVVEPESSSEWIKDSDGYAKYSVQLPTVENEEKEYYVELSYADASGNKLTSNSANLDVNDSGVYTSDILVVDCVAPVVEFAGYYTMGTDGLEEVTDHEEYADDEYTYFSQEQVYLKLQVTEHNFRSHTASDYALEMLASWLDGTEEDRTEAFKKYLTETNWEQDEDNSDIHYIMIPVNDTDNGFGEARYDISVNYTDLAGNSQEEAAANKMVYDITNPVIGVEYSQSVGQKVSATLSKVFWFFKDEVTATITVTDKTAGTYSFHVYGEQIEDQIAEDAFETLDFTINYQENAAGEIEVAGSIGIDKEAIEQENGVTTITVKIPAQYRDGLSVSVEDKAALEAEYQEKVDETPVVIVADNLPPVLNAITYTKPIQVVEPSDLSTVENAVAYDDYYLYYDGTTDIEVTLELKEINFYDGIDEAGLEKYFEELVTVELYRSEVLTSASDSWEKVSAETPVELIWSKEGEDVYKLTFTVSGEEEGHYYYTVSCEDNSTNEMVSFGDATTYDPSKVEDGKYISPVFTIDGTAPEVEFAGYYTMGTDGLEEVTDHEEYADDEYTYFSQEQVYLKLQVTEHNFRSHTASDYALEMLASWLDGTEEDRTEAFKKYLTETNWEQDEDNSDIHYIMIPVNDTDNGFGEARYDISVNYTDLAGNSQEEAAANKMVYDITNPVIGVEYSQSVGQKVSATLSKVFWFFKDEVTATITVTDKTAGTYSFHVYGAEVEEQISENAFETLDFTINYQEDAAGKINITGSIGIDEKAIEQNNGVTTITVKIPAQYRDGLAVEVEDKASLKATYQAKEDETPVVIVVDKLPPMLNAITYTEPVQTVDPQDNMATVEFEENAPRVYDDYYLYYDGTKDIEVTLELKEINFYDGMDDEQLEKYFEELVTVELYRSDVLTDDLDSWEKVSEETPVELTWVKASEDVYKLTFKVSGETEGHYYYTVSCEDNSTNEMVSFGDATTYDPSKVEDGEYISPVFTIDKTAPVVECVGYYTGSNGDQEISGNDILTYTSESGEGIVQYNYFNQEQFNPADVSQGDVSEGNAESAGTEPTGYDPLYWKLQITEHNFRSHVAGDYALEMMASWLDDSKDANKTEALKGYLVNEENWKVDEENSDIHYIMIPISDDTYGFGEARYDITVNYTDLAGNTQEEAVVDHVVYDVTRPVMQVEYTQTWIQKVGAVLSKYFWFFKNNVTATITVDDKTSGAYYFDVSGGNVEDQIKDNNFKTIDFTLDYAENVSGKLVNDGSVEDVKYTQENGVTTITVTIPAEYRGSLSAIAYDKTKLHTGTYHVTEEGLPVTMVVDETSPVLDVIKYNVPQQVVEPESKETLAEQTNVYDGYNLYYGESINVTFEITEANWFAGMNEDQEEYFKELLEVKLFRADELVDTTSAEWKEVEEVEIEWKRLDEDTYQMAFTIPVDQATHEGDGHYYYTITAKDYSDHALVASAAEDKVKGYKAGMLSDGTYTSPVLTIDTINPQVEVQYYDENQTVDFAQGVHEYYQGASATIELIVTEHNFRPSDAIITMEAVDVNGKKDAVESVEAANELIAEVTEALKANKNNAVWTREGDVYTATIVLNSPKVDANYTFGISYKDMANHDADQYYYNGAEAVSTPVQGDTFTLDSIAPVITAIDNDAASDITYTVENTSDWAKFLNYATFGYFWKEKIVVTVVAHDDISGVNTITYDAYLTENDAVTKTEAVASATVKAVNKVEGDNAARYITFALAPDFKGDVVASAVDFAVNTCEDETLKGVVLESAGQHLGDGEHVGISIQTAASRTVDGVNYYNSDVTVSFRYRDTYSGLNSVSYSLAGSGKFDKDYMIENEDLVYEDEIIGTVEAGKNNYNGVVISSEYMDNAGYSGSIEETINIDITVPEISVVYDENEPRNEQYYNKVRTATVTVTERNFQDGDVVFTITNTDGTMPEISGWSHSAANGVSDETTHTCTVTFNADGDYTFTVGCQDLAGNVALYDRVDEFTIDLTVPEVSVQYDNNDYLNDYYYDDYRTATISIMEHNFNPVDVNIVMTAENDGAAVDVPSVSSWSRNGDLSTATIYYNKDAEYTFDISFMDMAGNEMADRQQEHFVIDTIAPELEITDVKNYTAHNGKIQPTITYSDVNRDEESFVVTLDGYKNGKITPEYLSTEIHNGVEIVLQDPEHIRKNDDLYTLRASVMDKAGNTSEAEVIYSVNRFGSIFVLDEATEKFVNDYYHMQEQDLVVREINVDTITSAEVTYSVNGQVVTMSEDDYTVVSTGTRDTWKENVYTLKKTNFETEGEYSVTITSKDEAKNAMSNKTYSTDEDGEALIAFVIDKTNPYCIVTGVEDGKQYNEEVRTVTIDARDNTYLDTLQVLLDGTEIAAYDAEQLSAASGVVTLEIGSSNKRQTLEVIAKDKAGNYSESKTITFLITTNLFYQYINNKVAVGGTVAGVGVLAVAGGVASVLIKGGAAGAAASGASGAGTAAAAGLIGGFFAFFKRRKKEDDEE